MRKPNNLYFSSVSIIVVAEWPEKRGVPEQGSMKSAQKPSSFKRPQISLAVTTMCSVSCSRSSSISSDQVDMSWVVLKARVTTVNEPSAIFWDGKRSAICFLRSSGASWATTSSISADGRAGNDASREGEAQTTSSEPGLYLM